MSGPGRLTVVGIGAEGHAGLAPAAAEALGRAAVVVGAPRQLGLLPESLAARRVRLPAPLHEGLPGLLEDLAADPGLGGVAVLASGDPMFHGIGVTLARLLGPGRLRVLPAPSSAALACARLGWALHDTPVVSLVTGEVAEVAAVADRGRRFLVLARDAGSIAAVAAVLAERDPGAGLTLLADLGAAGERIAHGTAAAPPEPAGGLRILAVTPTAPARAWLADADFDTDGQLTKSPIRELTLAALGPGPGRLLWDIGGGTGSIAIEWARHGGRAACLERDPDRVRRIRGNAARLAPVTVVEGTAPGDLGLLAGGGAPEAIFIGGGLTAPGLVDACAAALAPGGRLVANAVTVESERVLWAARERHGGEIRRVQVDHPGRVGAFTVLRPALPVTQWIADPPPPGGGGGAP